MREKEKMEKIVQGEKYEWRIEMDKEIEYEGEKILWKERGEGKDGEKGRIDEEKERWGDVVIERKEKKKRYKI